MMKFLRRWRVLVNPYTRLAGAGAPRCAGALPAVTARLLAAGLWLAA